MTDEGFVYLGDSLSWFSAPRDNQEIKLRHVTWTNLHTPWNLKAFDELVDMETFPEIGIYFLSNKWFNSWATLLSDRKFRKYLLVIDVDRFVPSNSLEKYYIFQKIIFFRDLMKRYSSLIKLYLM